MGGAWSGRGTDFFVAVVGFPITVFCGLLYHNVTNDISGFQNRLGLVRPLISTRPGSRARARSRSRCSEADENGTLLPFFCIAIFAVHIAHKQFFFILSLFGFSCLTSLGVFANERALFLRERANGYYSPITYFISKVSGVSLPVPFAHNAAWRRTSWTHIIYVSMLRSCSLTFCRFASSRLSSWAGSSTSSSASSRPCPSSGSSSSLSVSDDIHALFTPVARTFLQSRQLTPLPPPCHSPVLFSLAASSAVLFISIAIADTGVANLVGSLTMLFNLLFAGLLINRDRIPFGLQKLQHVSFFHAAYEALIVNELRQLSLKEHKYGLEIEVPAASIICESQIPNRKLQVASRKSQVASRSGSALGWRALPYHLLTRHATDHSWSYRLLPPESASFGFNSQAFWWPGESRNSPTLLGRSDSGLSPLRTH